MKKLIMLVVFGLVGCGSGDSSGSGSGGSTGNIDLTRCEIIMDTLFADYRDSFGLPTDDYQEELKDECACVDDEYGHSQSSGPFYSEDTGTELDCIMYSCRKVGGGYMPDYCIAQGITEAIEEAGENLFDVFK